MRTWAFRAVAAALGAVVALVFVPGALAAPGDLDSTFGSSGVVLTPAGSGSGWSASGVLEEGDGKSVVVAAGADGSGSAVTKIARYGANGQLDSSFGDGGSGITSLSAFGAGRFSGVAVGQLPGGGDLIVGGTLLSGSSQTGDFALVALNPSNGALDTTWGTGGIVHTALGDSGSDSVTALALDPSSGEIFVGGDAQVGGTGEFALAAYDASGSPENTFGSAGNGTELTQLAGGDAQINALALDGTSVVAAGQARSGGVATVARYGSDGQPSSGFPVTVPIGSSTSAADSVLVQSDHKIVVGGYGVFSSTSCLALARLNSDGTPDTGFGQSATAHVCPGSVSAANAILSSPDGLYAAGYDVASGHTQFALARFSSSGAPDGEFGSGGYVSSDPGGPGVDAQANAIALDGVHPVVVGEANASPQTQFALERFTGGTPPANTAVPTIGANASPTVGQQISGSPGSWSGTQPVGFTYTWLRCPGTSPTGCATAQSGASSSYTLTGDDAGQHMLLKVSGSNLAGSADAYSAATPAVLAPPASISAPKITGTTDVLQTLTAQPGTWSGSQPISYTYTWLSCPGPADLRCDVVQSGSSPSYTLQLSDASRRIAVRVAASNSVGGATALSDFTAAIGLGDLRPPQFTGCGQHVSIGPISATGCFKPVGETWVASGEVSIDGIDLLPDAADATVVFDPKHLTVTATGSYQMQLGPVVIAKHKFGPWLAYKGKFKWDFSANGLPHLTLPKILPPTIELPGPFQASLPAIPLPVLHSFNFLGFPVVGTPTLKPSGGGVAITVPVSLPKVLGGITGQLVLHADESTGLRFGGVSVTVPDLLIGPVEIKQTSLGYLPDTNEWQAGTTIVLPTPNRNEVGASMDIIDGRVKSISAVVGKANIPLGPGFFLQNMAASLSFSPLHIGGDVGISAGPNVLGKTAAEIDGALTYDLGDTSKLEVSGTLTVAGIKLAQASLDYLVSPAGWSIDLSGQLGYTYTIKGPYGTSATIGATGVVKGDIYGGGDFYFDAAAQIQAPLITAQGEVRANRKALAGCAAIGPSWHQLAGGFVYPWGGKPQVFTGCDLGQYVSDSHAARAADASLSVRLPSQLPMAAIKVIGSGGPPVVTLSGPNHARLAVPATGEGLKNSQYLAYRDPEDNTTYLLINHPAGGRWSVTPAPGSPPIAGLQTADGLPAPSVRATVSGSGRVRKLHYRLKPLRGQVVRFLERGSGVSRVLAVARSASGTMAIRPSGTAGMRTVVAEVLQDGTPRATLTVTRYRAPSGVLGLAAPRLLRVTRQGSRIIVTFSAVRGATQYLVHIDSSIGASTQQLLPGSRHRIVINSVLPQARIRATVRAIGRYGQAGRPARTSLTPHRPVKHPPSHRQNEQAAWSLL